MSPPMVAISRFVWVRSMSVFLKPQWVYSSFPNMSPARAPMVGAIY
jgi:hypothetical protein